MRAVDYQHADIGGKVMIALTSVQADAEINGIAVY